MTTGTPLPAFKHDPLPEHKSYFRLLHIIRGDFGQRIECEISSWLIGEAPPYYAISYVWGDTNKTTDITVNGSRLEVRRNCEYALQQAFTTKACKYVWVDAICIDQTTEEKNHQVGIMDQIYSGAKHVLACVGPHEDNSEILLKFIKKHRSILTRLHDFPHPWSTFSLFSVAMDHKRIFLRCLLSVNGRTRQAIYQSFRSFMRRPYFTRLWIMQELSLASRVSFCFGAVTERAEDFLALFWVLKFWEFSGRRYRKPESGARASTISIMRAICLSSSPNIHLIGEIICLLSSFRHKGCPAIDIEFEKTIPFDRLQLACTEVKQSFHKLLFYVQADCSDPRDRLYGVLSVVDWPHTQKPEVNYEKDRYEVALDATRLLRVENPDTTRELCRIFQVTGEEASLRRTPGQWSSTSLPTVRSRGRNSDRMFRDLHGWTGFKIGGTLNAIGHFNTYGRQFECILSLQENEGSCVLKVEDGQEVMLMRGPLDTRKGDWLIFQRNAVEQDLALIIRRSRSNIHRLVGHVFVRECNHLLKRLRVHCSGYPSFLPCWTPEDVLLSGWTAHQLDSDNITQDQVSELVNRQLYTWDDSSYFERWEERV